MALRGDGGRRLAAQWGDTAEAAAAGAGGVVCGVGAILGVGRVCWASGAGGVSSPAAGSLLPGAAKSR